MWEENSILYTYNERTRPAEIFQAFCDELGKHYQKKGMKYFRSGPRIVLDTKRNKIVLTFNSSRSNTPGRSVMIELGVFIFDLELDSKNPVFNSFTMFSKKLDTEEQGRIIIENLVGEQITRKEENVESEFRYNKNFKVYGLSENGFQQVISFLDGKVFAWSEDLYDTVKVKVLIEELGSWGRNFTNKEMLTQFLAMQHPTINY